MSKEEKLFRSEIERHAGANCLVPLHIDFQIVDA